jgi:hypothetical protein
MTTNYKGIEVDAGPYEWGQVREFVILARQYAQKVNLPLTRISFTKDNSLTMVDTGTNAVIESIPRHYDTYHIGSSWSKGHLELEVQENSLNPPPHFRRALMREEICHAKDMQEGLYAAHQIIPGIADPNSIEGSIYTLAFFEFQEAYVEYLAMLRNKTSFGAMDEVRQFQQVGLESFLKETYGIMREVFTETQNHFVWVAGLYSSLDEIIKTKLCELQPSYIPPSLFELSALVTGGFDIIKDQHLEWENTANLLNYFASILDTHLDLVNSYAFAWRDNKIFVLNDSKINKKEKELRKVFGIYSTEYDAVTTQLNNLVTEFKKDRPCVVKR